MPIFDLFSKRQKRLRGEISDVYTYDNLPRPLRVQIVYIIRATIGESVQYYSTSLANQGYAFIHHSLSKEYGLFSLGRPNDEDQDSVLSYFLETKEFDKAMDVVEFSFRYITTRVRGYSGYRNATKATMTPDESIEELNERFKEHGVGYVFEAGEIIRVDSTYAHSEIVKPTISLLQSRTFEGANEEYLKAHEHYRHGRNKECLTDCLKALESVLKTICKLKGWSYQETDTSSKLIQICFTNELVPSYTQNQYTSLQNLLVSGIPTLRNKVGAHGQGQVPQMVDDELARYGLNLTGTNIILLIELSGIK